MAILKSNTGSIFGKIFDKLKSMAGVKSNTEVNIKTRSQGFKRATGKTYRKLTSNPEARPDYNDLNKYRHISYPDAPGATPTVLSYKTPTGANREMVIAIQPEFYKNYLSYKGATPESVLDSLKAHELYEADSFARRFGYKEGSLVDRFRKLDKDIKDGKYGSVPEVKIAPDRMKAHFGATMRELTTSARHGKPQFEANVAMRSDYFNIVKRQANIYSRSGFGSMDETLTDKQIVDNFKGYANSVIKHYNNTKELSDEAFNNIAAMQGVHAGNLKENFMKLPLVERRNRTLNYVKSVNEGRNDLMNMSESEAAENIRSNLMKTIPTELKVNIQEIFKEYHGQKRILERGVPRIRRYLDAIN